jgi:hypothetical protein
MLGLFIGKADRLSGYASDRSAIHHKCTAPFRCKG